MPSTAYRIAPSFFGFKVFSLIEAPTISDLDPAKSDISEIKDGTVNFPEAIMSCREIDFGFCSSTSSLFCFPSAGAGAISERLDEEKNDTEEAEAEVE
jgi:hypothetical protein